MKKLNYRILLLILVPLFFVSIHLHAQNGAWKLIDSLPTPRIAMMNVCTADGKIYFIGGTNNAGTLAGLAANEAYDPLSNTWEKKQPMPTPRSFLATTVLNDTIYAIGGNWPSIKTVEAYDPVTDSWTTKADMPIPKNEIQAAVVDGKIYIMRGADELNGLVYDPNTNQWAEIKLSELPHVSSLAVFKNLVYIFGGTLSPTGPVFSSVYAYDPKTDTLIKKKDMPTPRFAFQTLVYNGKIYAMGGTKGGTPGNGTSLSTLEVYDPVADTWETKPNMPFSGAYLSGAVVNNKIYITEGTPDWAKGGKYIWEYDPEFHTDVAAGNVSGTWKQANSPYHINGEITIPNDSTLTIEPGVEIVFTGHYKFNVQGRLLAIGTKKDSIRFTAENEQTGWHGMRFDQTPNTNDTSIFEYCSFKYGKANTGSTNDRCGGAIFINKFDKVLISGCSFESNMNSGDMYSTGGAAIAILYASPTITNSSFLYNIGTLDGAILNAYNSSSVISNNTFSNNSSAWGVIVCYDGGKPIINSNTITNNLASGAYAGAAGILLQSGSNARVENNIITHNKVVGGYPTYAGGLCLYINVQAMVINNIIAYNSADFGGGIEISQNSNSILINNTIVYNTGKSGGGVFFRGNSDAVFINNILFGNTASNGNEIYIEDTQSDPHFLFCDIIGGKDEFKGAGSGANYSGTYESNIDSNPLFSDTIYNLSDSSQCIGAGIDSIEINGTMYHCPSICIMGNPRPSPAGSNPDIGACENLLASPLVGIEEVLMTPKDFALCQNYPNPFNPSTTISWQSPVSGMQTIKIFDLLGREVTILINEEKPAGTYEVTWNAVNLPSGVYFYQLKASNYTATKKLLLLK